MDSDLKIKFEKSLRFLIGLLKTIEDNDELKMRYISNFYEKIYRKDYIYLGQDNIIEAILNEEKNLDERSASMMRIIVYYLSSKDKKYLPNRVEGSPIEYYIAAKEVNEDLRERNIFVNDDNFRMV
ncbi:MAG TPA: hypothetical protein PLH43_06925 [Acetivibrio sp.]|uniref:hypothetical protein n=1 Tax=Acetivibrio sp. TaxID=1872092 RepID=UPI002BC6F909|nr:hypothetical protein [Acetivibrio sp.]HOM02543.1 hypothetical protein [Acetivibrio sp.]